MSRTRIVKGTYTKISAKGHHMYSAKDIITTAGKSIVEIGEKGGVTYGSPKKRPATPLEKSEYKLKSDYIHNHIKKVAEEVLSEFKEDSTGFVYEFYKGISEGTFSNPEIVVVKNIPAPKAFYEVSNRKIVIWENHLIDIEKDNDKKIKLIAELTAAYGHYINEEIKSYQETHEKFETYDYNLFKFDALGASELTIAELESPTYKGNLDISFPALKKEKKQSDKQDRGYFMDGPNRGGPNPGDSGFFQTSEMGEDHDGGPDDPEFNIGIKFSFYLNKGFSASLFAGVSKQINSGDFGIMPSFNTALTYYGNGTPGTSPLSRSLVTASFTPAVTLGYKTGNPMNMNLFNQFSGSGVNTPYEFAFTVGSTGILSSGKVSGEYDKNGDKRRDEYNSHDLPHRHQIVGGASIKVGNFMISSYNDIYKPPLFFGMGSDQYWSAGVNAQARLTDQIHMAYAFDLYYGKSNNKNPYNLDKNIDGQNYDTQRLFDLLLNRGQETFTSRDSHGNITTNTRFGFGTFWPSNKMHGSIDFPEKPERPVEPIETNYNSKELFKEAEITYKEALGKYNRDLLNYNISIRINPFSTFHQLYVVYGFDNKIDFNRFKRYYNADIPNRAFQELYKIEHENTNSKDDNKENNNKD